MRHICYISGTRADFGLMQSTLVKLQNSEGCQLSVVATGMHLDAAYGATVDEIRTAGLNVVAEVPVPLTPANGATMARNIGTMTREFTDVLEREAPDIVLLLGDRGEMLAGAIAASHLGIIVVHIHGGERSGTVDEPVRHAISKLSHVHFTATEGAKQRLVRMGEAEDNIFVTGAPGIDGLAQMQLPTKIELFENYNLAPDRPTALFVYHPVLHEADSSGERCRIILESLIGNNVQILALKPNSDAGSENVQQTLAEFADNAQVSVQTHLPRQDFLAAMAHCDLMIGNSSAGIIEAASFGIRVINVGQRQNLRERNANVIDIADDRANIEKAISEALSIGRCAKGNIYGDGNSAEQIASLLDTLNLDHGMLAKVNSY
jgi:GDP/UDP-N,N'-diacetylbacillosamine 2-epimerase (hydrolysing)